MPVVDGNLDLRARWGQLMAMPWFFSFWEWLPANDPEFELVKNRDPSLQKQSSVLVVVSHCQLTLTIFVLNSHFKKKMDV